MNSVSSFVKKISLDLLFFYSLFIFLTVKIFLLNDHFFEHDELVNFTTYYYKETILLKNYPNNHFYISFMGIIFDFFLGTKILLFKFFNYLTLPLIIYVCYKSFKNKFLIYLLLLIYLLSDILFDYSYILRGYYLSSLFFCVVFYLILNNLSEPKDFNFKMIFLICAFQIINNVSSLYLIIPVFLAIFLNSKPFYFKKKLKFFLIYFMPVFFILNTNQIIVTGLYFESFYDSHQPLLKFVVQNFKSIYFKGFESIFLTETLNTSNTKSLLGNLDLLIIDIKDNIILFTIFLISFLILLKNIFRKRLIIFDYIILYFFILYILLNKLPPERVYVGFVYFFIFYVFYFLRNFEFKVQKFNYFILVLIFTLIIFENNFLNRSNLNLKNDLEIDLKKKFKCHLKNQNLSEIAIHFYYYLYLKNCDKKRDLNEFVKFYRDNNNN